MALVGISLFGALLGGAALLANVGEPTHGQIEETAQAAAPKTKSALEEFPNPGDGSPDMTNQAGFELFLTLRPGDNIDNLLTRAGASRADATRAASLIGAGLSSGLGPDPEITILLGEKVGADVRRLERLKVRNGAQVELLVTRDGTGLRLARQEIAPGVKLIRLRGEAGSNLYWSMRAAGATSDIALQFLEALATHLSSAKVAPKDVFDLIVADPRHEGSGRPALLYVGLETSRGRDIRLVNWKVGESSVWADPQDKARVAPLIKPVDGRISSHFGSRSHPILRLIRFHRGIDIAASWGSPVMAAADGRVVGAGSRGGYGRQVRLAHARGLETSYSHLSQIIGRPGEWVRQGQLIGYVGSTGLSTGAHLHYEVHKEGRPVDPLVVQSTGGFQLGVSDQRAIATRFKHLMSSASAPATRSKAS